MGTWADNRSEILEAVSRLPALPWSVRLVVDDHGRDTGFAVLRGHIQEEDREAFNAVAATHRIVGAMQWWGFPLPQYSYGGENYEVTPRRPASEPWHRPELDACEAWCYCARDPDTFLPPGRPRFFISNSDFVDADGVREVAHGRSQSIPAPKRWDVICSFSGHWWDEIQKNWSLARQCVTLLAGDLGLSVLLLSRRGIPDVPRHPNVEVRPRMSWEECIGCIARARLALFPNHLDPSPRVITESLALDVPVVVYSEILGGWKYVQTQTGRFFEGEWDVAAEVLHALSFAPTPRRWLDEHYGRDLVAHRFAGHLRSLGDADHIEYALPTALFL
jgi:hypothetical protein